MTSRSVWLEFHYDHRARAAGRCGRTGRTRGGVAFEFSQCRGLEAADDAVVNDDHLVLIQPFAYMHRKLFTIGAAQHFVAQHPHERSALVVAHQRNPRVSQASC